MDKVGHYNNKKIKRESDIMSNDTAVTVTILILSLYLAIWLTLLVSLFGRSITARALGIEIYHIPASFFPIIKKVAIEDEIFQRLNPVKKILFIASGPCANFAFSILVFFSVALLMGEGLTDALMLGIRIVASALALIFSIILGKSDLGSELNIIGNISTSIATAPMHISSIKGALGITLVMTILLAAFLSLIKSLMSFGEEGGMILKEVLAFFFGKDSTITKLAITLFSGIILIIALLTIKNIFSILF